MDSSARADSQLEIRLVASSDEAKRNLASAAQEIGRALQGLGQAATDAGAAGAEALEKTAEAGKKAAAEIEKTGEKAKLTAGQLRAVAAGFAGMAIGAIGAYQDAHGGRSSGTAYAQGALSQGLQGAAMGGMVGGVPGAMIGGAVGAGMGLFTTYQQRLAVEKSEEEARKAAVAGMHEQVRAYEELRERTEAFRRVLEGLSDSSSGAAAREETLRREIDEREAADARLAEAQRAAADAADQEAFAKASRERQLNAQELSSLRRVEVREDAPDEGGRHGRSIDIGPMDSGARKGMDLVGAAAGIADAQVQLSREANSLAKQQLETQRALVSAVSHLSTSGGVARWGT